MEKIKASEVLKRFAYWAVDEDSYVRIHSRMPSIVGDSWRIEDFNPKLDSVYTIGILTVPIISWKNSLREIDFSEDFAEERISLINRIDSYLAKELSLRDYNRIKGFFEAKDVNLSGSIKIPKDSPMYEQIKKIGVGRPVFIDSNEKVHELVASKSIFQEGDTVHILSYSNQWEFGVSTQGVVKAIKSNSFVAVEIVNGIEEIHEKKNISFTPFSIHEAGFSQVRPVREPNVGDWGFFYDDTPVISLYYDKLFDINEGAECQYAPNCLIETFKYFSHTPPQLAEGIPNPFDKC